MFTSQVSDCAFLDLRRYRTRRTMGRREGICWMAAHGRRSTCGTGGNSRSRRGPPSNHQRDLGEVDTSDRGRQRSHRWEPHSSGNLLDQEANPAPPPQRTPRTQAHLSLGGPPVPLPSSYLHGELERKDGLTGRIGGGGKARREEP